LLVVGVLEILELQVHEWTSCEVEYQTWFIRSIHEIPNVNTIGLRNEDHTWSCWGESTASIVRSCSVHRLEDWLLLCFHANLEQSKVEIVNSQNKVWEEWGSLKCQTRSVFLF